MATYLQHVKLQFGGTLGNPAVEEWSNTVRFAYRGAGGDPEQESDVVTAGELEDAMVAMEEPLAAWFNGPDSFISYQAFLTYMKLNMINDQGHQFDANTHRRELLYAGSVGGTCHYYETFALTMRTDVKRGRGNAGRIFPPMVVCPPEGSTPYISAAHADRMARAWAICLNDMSDALGDVISLALEDSQVRPVIAAPASSTGPNPGGALLREVRGVVVDRVADVQHRRTNRIPRSESAKFDIVGAV